MKIFGLGIPELIIILVIIVVLCGPALFSRLRKRTDSAVKGAKQGIEAGKQAADVKPDPEMEGKSPMEKVEHFQDKVDDWMDNRPDIDTGEGDEGAEQAEQAEKA
ncbi:MAG: hypothetical protein LUD25_03230 [Coriobacteriaceae bacterium]|nr:hypothetical protein [Coriobacteriaceae bacterium]